MRWTDDKKHFTDIPSELLVGGPGGGYGDPSVGTVDQQWKKWTGLPFVFAVWALRMAALSETSRDPDPATVLSRSRDHGTAPENIDTISRLWSQRVQLPESTIREYLTRHIHYTLDADNRAGLELFYRYSAELGLIAEAPSLRFYGHAAQQFVG